MHDLPAPIDAALFQDLATGVGPGAMLPGPAYTSEAVLAWEREHFFDRTWVSAGRVHGLEAPGTRRAVRVGERSVLLVRGDDGMLRAFSNVCRHRGHELQACGETVRRGSIACPYHAWTYSLDGALTQTPRFEEPAGFDPAAHGLLPLRVEEWLGFAMLNVSGDAVPLAEHVGRLGDLLDPYGIGSLEAVASHEYLSPCNWKLPIENYHECYHCPAIHPELCVLSTPDSGDNHPGGELWVGGTLDLRPGVETMSTDGRSRAPFLPGLDADARRQVLYVGLFPNLLISAHPDYVMVHRIEPRSPRVTWVECSWLFAPGAADAPGFDVAPVVDFWDLTNRQDWAACEGVQRGIEATGADGAGFVPGPFSAREDAVAQWVRMVARSYLAGRVVPDTAPGAG